MNLYMIYRHTTYNWMWSKSKHTFKNLKRRNMHAQTKRPQYINTHEIYHLMNSYICAAVGWIGWRKRIASCHIWYVVNLWHWNLCARCGLIMLRYSIVQPSVTILLPLKTDHAHKCLLSIFAHRKNRHTNSTINGWNFGAPAIFDRNKRQWILNRFVVCQIFFFNSFWNSEKRVCWMFVWQNVTY